MILFWVWLALSTPSASLKKTLLRIFMVLNTKHSLHQFTRVIPKRFSTQCKVFKSSKTPVNIIAVWSMKWTASILNLIDPSFCSSKTMKSLRNSQIPTNSSTKSTKSSMKRTIARRRPTKCSRRLSSNKLLCRRETSEEALTSSATTRSSLRLEGSLLFRHSFLRTCPKRLRSEAALVDRGHLAHILCSLICKTSLSLILRNKKSRNPKIHTRLFANSEIRELMPIIKRQPKWEMSLSWLMIDQIWFAVRWSKLWKTMLNWVQKT